MNPCRNMSGRWLIVCLAAVVLPCGAATARTPDADEILFPLLMQENILSQEVGADHPGVLVLRKQIETVRKLQANNDATATVTDKETNGIRQPDPVLARDMAKELLPLLMQESILSQEVGADHPKLHQLRKQIEVTRNHWDNVLGIVGDKHESDASAEAQAEFEHSIAEAAGPHAWVQQMDTEIARLRSQLERDNVDESVKASLRVIVGQLERVTELVRSRSAGHHGGRSKPALVPRPELPVPPVPDVPHIEPRPESVSMTFRDDHSHREQARERDHARDRERAPDEQRARLREIRVTAQRLEELGLPDVADMLRHRTAEMEAERAESRRAEERRAEERRAEERRAEERRAEERRVEERRVEERHREEADRPHPGHEHAEHMLREILHGIERLSGEVHELHKRLDAMQDRLHQARPVPPGPQFPGPPFLGPQGFDPDRIRELIEQQRERAEGQRERVEQFRRELKEQRDRERRQRSGDRDRIRDRDDSDDERDRERHDDDDDDRDEDDDD